MIQDIFPHIYHNEYLPGKPEENSRILFYEEGIRTGGIGEQCGSRLLEEGFHGRYRIFAVEERFIPQCSQDTAFHSIEADRNSIVHTVLGEENR